MFPALFVYLRYIPYIPCADIILILRNPPIRPISHILQSTALFSLFFMGVYPSSYRTRIPTIYPLYHVGLYPDPPHISDYKPDTSDVNPKLGGRQNRR